MFHSGVRICAPRLRSARVPMVFRPDRRAHGDMHGADGLPVGRVGSGDAGRGDGDGRRESSPGPAGHRERDIGMNGPDPGQQVGRDVEQRLPSGRPHRRRSRRGSTADAPGTEPSAWRRPGRRSATQRSRPSAPRCCQEPALSPARPIRSASAHRARSAVPRPPEARVRRLTGARRRPLARRPDSTSAAGPSRAARSRRSPAASPARRGAAGSPWTT